VPWFARRVGRRFFEGRYTIGLWHWEVEQFSTEFLNAFEFVDEVWMASEFSQRAVEKVAPCPVFAFPLPIVAPSPVDDLDVSSLIPTDRFVFLFVFDFLSVFERKNPVALVESFRSAFPPGEGPILVIKSINGDRRPEEWERLRAAAAGHPDIKLIDGYVSADRKRSMMSSCNCYVSLHRSEGFGITMAEAMSLGKPVIATAYSGNLEFMTTENSYLVPYTLIPIGAASEPYPAEARWAAPDLESAARLMREVYEDPEGARRKGTRARNDVLELHGPHARAEFIRQRYEVRRLWRIRRDGSSVPVASPHERSNAARRPARILLRRLDRPVAFFRDPPPSFRRPVAILRRLLRRPYYALLRASGGFSVVDRGASRGNHKLKANGRRELDDLY
jgi:glycosyltransferase involved in cell wall biosynthesis